MNSKPQIKNKVVTSLIAGVKRLCNTVGKYWNIISFKEQEQQLEQLRKEIKGLTPTSDNTKHQNNKAHAIVIDFLLMSHGGIYRKVEDRSNKLGKKILIFNADAHSDKYYGGCLDAYWAGMLEKEGKAIVLHMPSYWDGGRDKEETNWRNRIFPKWYFGEELRYYEYLLRQYEKSKNEVEENWLTIDYDFFSLFTEVLEDDEAFIQPRLPIYHLSAEGIDKELVGLVEFFENNNIKIDRVVPSLPSSKIEYLNIPFGENKKRYIDYITKKINSVFSELSQRQINKYGFQAEDSSSSPVASRDTCSFDLAPGANLIGHLSPMRLLRPSLRSGLAMTRDGGVRNDKRVYGAMVGTQMSVYDLLNWPLEAVIRRWEFFGAEGKK